MQQDQSPAPAFDTHFRHTWDTRGGVLGGLGVSFVGVYHAPSVVTAEFRCLPHASPASYPIRLVEGFGVLLLYLGLTVEPLRSIHVTHEGPNGGVTLFAWEALGLGFLALNIPTVKNIKFGVSVGQVLHLDFYQPDHKKFAPYSENRQLAQKVYRVLSSFNQDKTGRMSGPSPDLYAENLRLLRDLLGI